MLSGFGVPHNQKILVERIFGDLSNFRILGFLFLADGKPRLYYNTV